MKGLSSKVESLLLFPLKPELKHFSAAADQLGTTQSERTEFGLFLPEHRALLAIGGHGKSEFGVTASKLLASLPSAKRLFCLGVAGSLANHVKALDIVIGESTVEHDYKLGFSERAAPPEFQSRLLGQLELKKENFRNFRIHFGKIASGDEDIVTKQRATEIAKQTQALCVAWEGAGGARAARAHRVDYLEVRAISDICDENVESDFEQNLPKAMANLRQLLPMLIEPLKHRPPA